MTTAVFTRGSTMRHVLVMTGASAMGLLSMFGVDLVDKALQRFLECPVERIAVGGGRSKEGEH